MTDDTRSQAAPEATPEKKETVGSFLRFLFFLVLATVLVRSLVVAPFTIPSGSMLPTLWIGDYLFVSKWPYGYSRYSFPFGIIPFDGRVLGSIPDRGDVVVFRYPGRDEDFVKRVVGVPGDIVELRGGEVVLNGQPVQRERIADFIVPVSENSPCQPRTGVETRLIVQPDGERVCAYPRFRETLPGGRSYHVLDQVRDMSARRNLTDETGVGADNVAPFTVPQGRCS